MRRGNILEASLFLGSELCVKAISSLKAELRAHILDSRISRLPDEKLSVSLAFTCHQGSG